MPTLCARRSLVMIACFMGALLIAPSCKEADEAPSDPVAVDPQFVPATSPEDKARRVKEPEPLAQEEPEPLSQEQPDLREAARLSEDALELAYKIDELHSQAIGQGRASKKKKRARTLHPARVIFVTNFDKADITINGLVYPEYYEDEEEEGMLLPAGGPYDVQVAYGGSAKGYELSLKPYEKRYLVVDLSGYKSAGVAPARPTPPQARPSPVEKKPAEEDETMGRVTVYSKPRGDIMVDGKEAGKRTPNTVEVAEGRHEVQVRYESGELSEKKIVRARKGSRIKLFFREPK